MWTMDSTEGFTQDELDTINAALEQLMPAGGDEQDEINLSENINNVWVEGMTTAEIIEAVTRRRTELVAFQRTHWPEGYREALDDA